MVEKTSHFIEIKKPDGGHPTNEDSSKIRFLRLEDGRLIPIETGGMVDIAMRELGAKIVEMDRIEAATDSKTT